MSLAPEGAVASCAPEPVPAIALEILDNLGDSVALLDQDWRYVYLNSKAASMARMPRDHMIGQVIWDLFPELASTPAFEHLHAAMDGRVASRFEQYYAQYDLWVEIGVYPAGDGVVLSARDVTETKRAEATLRESEKRYRALFETSGDGILIVDDAGRYVDVNESFCRILKATKPRLIGAHFSEFIPPDRLEEARQAFTNLQTGNAKPLDFPLRALDGTIVDLSWTASSYYLPGLHFCVCRDLTGRYRAEQDRAFLLAREQETRVAAEQLNRVGAILAAELDPGKLVQSVTEIATRLAGAEFGAFFHGGLSAGVESVVLNSVTGMAEDIALDRGSALFAATIRRAQVVRIDDLATEAEHAGAFQGSSVARSYLAVPVVSRSGEVLGGLFFGHSAPGMFAERQEMIVRGIASQAAIAMDNARLFEQAQWIQAELKRSNEDLRRANRDLETFAYSASHDLQEPLRNVSIYTQLLERKLGSTLDQEASRFFQGILKGTERMHHLVVDLLSYSRATRQAEGPIPTIDAAGVLSSVVQSMKTRIDQAGAEIEADSLPKVRMHEVHLMQLFQNLISNALKYRSKELPRIRVSAARQDGWWTLSVADNGIGIDPKYRAQIFGLFKRLHSRDQYSGSGVGLAICQRIVEHYGGRIWADGPESGTGSVFRFTIPDKGD